MDKLASLSARAKQNPGVATFRYAGVKVAGAELRSNGRGETGNVWSFITRVEAVRNAVWVISDSRKPPGIALWGIAEGEARIDRIVKMPPESRVLRSDTINCSFDGC